MWFFAEMDVGSGWLCFRAQVFPTGTLCPFQMVTDLKTDCRPQGVGRPTCRAEHSLNFKYCKLRQKYRLEGWMQW